MKMYLNYLNSNTLSLNGLIYNIEPGFYQLFLKSKERNEKEILYTSLIQSFPGKTQIVTEPYEQSQFNSETKLICFIEWFKFRIAIMLFLGMKKIYTAF